MLVSIQEVARVLGVSDRHIRRMMAKGRYPFYRIGDRAVRLDIDEIKSVSRSASLRSSESGGSDSARK
jgi:excisionase family DNA binding protein